MLRALGLLLVCQLAGETLVRLGHWPVPGPVMGLMLLAAGLFGAGRFGWFLPEMIGGTDLGKTSTALLGALGILFVPAGAGVVQHFGLIMSHGAALGLALIGSTVLTLVVTAAVFVGVRRLIDKAST